MTIVRYQSADDQHLVVVALTAIPASAVVNEYSVLSILAFWSGVRFLSETLASLPKSDLSPGRDIATAGRSSTEQAAGSASESVQQLRWSY